MDNAIIRLMSFFVALGSAGLFWVFGVFIHAATKAARLLSLSGSELQVLGVSLFGGLLVAWCSLYLLKLSYKGSVSASFRYCQLCFIVFWILSSLAGTAWTPPQ